MLKCIHCGNDVQLDDVCEQCGNKVSLEAVVGDSLPEILYWLQMKKGSSIVKDVKRLNGYIADLIYGDDTEAKIFKRLLENRIIEKTEHFFNDFTNCKKYVKRYLSNNEGLSEEWSEIIYRDLLICNDYRQWEMENDFIVEENVLLKCTSQAKIIYIPDDIKEIGQEALTSLPVEQIVLGENVEIISSGAFSYCKKLKEVIFNSKTKVIEELAFSNCENLETIILPRELEKLSSWAFDGCINLSQIQSYSLKYNVLNGAVFENNFYKLLFVLPGKNIEKYILPEECQEISEGAFRDNRTLKHILFKNHIKIIDMYAFENCSSLQTVIAPFGIEKIGWRAFANCAKLKEVYFGRDVRDVQFNAFEQCDIVTVYSSEYASVLHNFCKLQSMVYKVGTEAEYARLMGKALKC